MSRRVVGIILGLFFIVLFFGLAARASYADDAVDGQQYIHISDDFCNPSNAVIQMTAPTSTWGIKFTQYMIAVDNENFNAGGWHPLSCTNDCFLGYPDGPHTLYVQFGDSSGANTSSTYWSFIYFDSTPPRSAGLYACDQNGNAITSANGDYYIEVKTYDPVVNGVDSGIGHITVNTWTEKDGQGGLVSNCYNDLSDSWQGVDGSGNCVWRVPVSLGNHNWESGTYITKVYATDVAGNQVLLGTVDVDDTGDTTPPTATSVTTPATYTNADSYTVYANGVTDSQSGVASVSFATWVDINGAQDYLVWNAGTYDAANNRWYYTVNRSDHNNETGLYLTDAYAWDKAGNEACLGRAGVNIDLTPPTANSVTTSTAYTNADSYTVYANGVSDQSGVANVKFETVLGLNSFWGAGKYDQANNRWYYTINVNYPGKYTTYVYAYDNAGNQACLGTATVTADDLTPPTANSVTTPAAYTNADSYTVYANGVSDQSGVASVMFENVLGLNAFWGAGTYDPANNRWYCTVNVEVILYLGGIKDIDGKYYSYAYATDNAGNSAFLGEATVNIIQTPPAAPDLTIQSQTVNANTIDIEGTAEAGCTIQVARGGVLIASGTTGSDGNFTVNVTLAQNTVNNLSITAVDEAGNESAASTVAITEEPLPTYAVTYDAGPGSGAAPATASYHAGDIVTVASPGDLTDSNGNTFAGWVDVSGHVYYPNDTFSMPAAPVTLGSIWMATPPIASAVIYKSNGGSGTPPATDIGAPGSTVTVASQGGLSDSGYSFGGWESVSGHVYQASDTFNMPPTPITLTAVWNAVYYTLIYSAANLAPPTITTYTAGATVTVAGGPSINGYSFEGWEDVSGYVYQASDTFSMPAAPVTLTTVLNAAPAQTYSLTYSANDGSGTPPSTANYTPGATVTVADQGDLTYNGYTFEGWESVSGDVYQPGDTFSMPAAPVTLSGVWNPDPSLPCSVSYSADGGSGTLPATANYAPGATVTLADQGDLAYNGCTFGGWEDVSGYVYQASDTFSMPAAPVTLTAVWSTIYRILTYNPANGIVPVTLSYVPGDTVTVAGQGDLTDNTYAFDGWKDASGHVYQAGDTFTMPETPVTLTAVWNAGGGGGHGSSTATNVSTTTTIASSSTGTITPSTGGTVWLNSEAGVTIPNDALQGSASATVSITNASSPPAPPAGDALVGAYDFTVNGGGYTFNSPVTLAFTFDPSLIPGGDVPIVAYYDNTTGDWVLVPGSMVAGDTITVTVNHFTTFAVMAVPQATVPSAPASASSFSDVPSSFWGFDAISSLSAKGIVSGYPDGTFKPNSDITRAEFCAMLVKTLGISGSGTSIFTDVTPSEWYYNSVSTAIYAGLVSGMGNGLFDPSAPITREQMAVMIAKALGSNAPAVTGTELNAFSDGVSVSSWAVKGMDVSVRAGIANGVTSNALAPLDNATRAQAAKMIYKMLGLLTSK